MVTGNETTDPLTALANIAPIQVAPAPAKEEPFDVSKKTPVSPLMQVDALPPALRMKAGNMMADLRRTRRALDADARATLALKALKVYSKD